MSYFYRTWAQIVRMSGNPVSREAVEVMARDTLITKEFEAVKDNPQKALQVLMKREQFLSQATRLPTITDLEKLLFSSMQADALRDISLFSTKSELNDQIRQIITRLDNLENDVKALKDKLNTR